MNPEHLRGAIVVLLLAIAAFALWSLVSGASYLEAALPGGLPIGNALSAIGLCVVAGSAAGLSARGTRLRSFSVATLIASVAWLPASIALAGNLALNFHGDRRTAWLALSPSTGAAVLCALCWAVNASLLSRRRRSRAA